MKATAIWDRVQVIKEALGIKTDAEFGRIAGASKAVVNQWKSGLIQTISANYAYSIQDKTGFSARWIMTGQGPQSLSTEPADRHKLEPDAQASRNVEGALKEVECISTLIAYVDDNRVCQFANRAYQDWFGKTADEAIGRSLKEALGPLYERSKTQLARAFAGHSQVFEISIPAHDGVLHESIVSYMPDLSKGIVHGVCVYTADVTLLKPHERGQFFERQSITHYGSVISGNRDPLVVLKILLDRTIQRAERDNLAFAVVTIEIENFKEITSEIERNVVGVMLKDAAEVAREVVHNMDFSVLLKDWRLVCVLNGIRNKDVVCEVVSGMDAVLRKALLSKTKSVAPILRAGVSYYPENGATPWKLLRSSRHACSRV